MSCNISINDKILYPTNGILRVEKEFEFNIVVTGGSFLTSQILVFLDNQEISNSFLKIGEPLNLGPFKFLVPEKEFKYSKYVTATIIPSISNNFSSLQLRQTSSGRYIKPIITTEQQFIPDFNKAITICTELFYEKQSIKTKFIPDDKILYHHGIKLIKK